MINFCKKCGFSGVMKINVGLCLLTHEFRDLSYWTAETCWNIYYFNFKSIQIIFSQHLAKTRESDDS